jgi:hypothetical protein
MRLGETGNVSGLDFRNAARVDDAICYHPVLDQAFENVRGGWLDLVIVSSHCRTYRIDICACLQQ